MLPQEYRDLLVVTATQAFPVPLTGQNFFNGVQPGIWAKIPLTASFGDGVATIVNIAEGEGWLAVLVQSLITKFPGRPEFSAVLAEVDREKFKRTTADPFQEVLLESGRPFVNRVVLRGHLRDLVGPTGSPALLIDGPQKTGKTFSFYLINHVATNKGFIVSKFRMSRLPKADELAAEILIRIGAADKPLPAIGVESAERWAEKLADIVAGELREKRTPRLFVFDEFSDTALPDGTVSFIVRLMTYADEELRLLLRVVLMRFRAPLPEELENVVLRDEASPFTEFDMVAAVMQVAKAREWAVTEEIVRSRVKEFHGAPGRTLSDGFIFLRNLLQKLAGTP